MICRAMKTAPKSRLLAAVVMLLSMSAPSLAADMYIRHHHHRHARAYYEEIFLHNYGPVDAYPGTNFPPDRVIVPVTGRPYGIYDGFDHRSCSQSAANYIGQDGRRHPCN